MSKQFKTEYQSTRITSSHDSVDERVLQPRNLKDEEIPGLLSNYNRDKPGVNPESRHEEPASFLDHSSFLVIAPTRQEMEEARLAIDNQAALCSSLREELDTRQRELVELKQRIQAEEAILMNRRASIAPARRIPLEVLSMIITAHVEENSGSVLVAMLVSRAWNQATLLARKIWSSISIIAHSTDDTTLTSSSDRNDEKFRECSSEPHLRYMLKMADKSPLDLSIICHQGHLLSDLGPSGEHNCKVHELLESFNKISKRPRIRSLDIQECHLAYKTFEHWDFSLLTTLSVCGDHRRLLNRIEEEATRLAKLDILGDDLLSFKKLPSLPHLRQVTLRGCLTQSTQQHLKTFGSITTLVLDRTVLHVSSRILLSQVQSLSLIHVSPFWPFDCPSLTKLTIKATSGCTHNETVRLPRLKELICPATPKPLFLRNFEAPSLEKLDMAIGCNKGTTYEVLNSIWPSKPGSNSKRTPIEDLRQKLDPKTLTIRNFSANHKDAARIFSRLTRCVELHLVHASGVSPDLFESISPKSRSRLCLPELKVFTMVEYGMDETPFVAAATAFVDRRRTVGAPLTRLAFLDKRFDPQPTRAFEVIKEGE